MAFGNNVTLDDILRYQGLPAMGGAAPDPSTLQAPTGMFGSSLAAPTAASPTPAQNPIAGVSGFSAPLPIPSSDNVTAQKVPGGGYNAPGGWADKLTNIGAILLSASGNPAGGALMQAQAQKRSEVLGQQRLDSENARADARLNKPQVHYGDDGSITTFDPATGKTNVIQQGTGKVGTIEQNYQFFNKTDPTGALGKQYVSQAAAGPPVMGVGPNGQPMMYSRSAMGGGASGPPAGAISMLKSDPSLAAHFDEKYGAGAAARVLGGASSGSPTFPAVMGALTQQESGGRVGISGPQTPYGRAQGSTQLLPATAQEQAHKLGLPWRPDLLIGTSDQAAQYQQALGGGYLQEGIQKTGNLRDGLRYYHGGPNRALWGPRTNAYADAVLSRLNNG